MNTRLMEVGGGSHEYQTYAGGGGVMNTRHMQVGEESCIPDLWRRGRSHEYQTYGGGGGVMNTRPMEVGKES